MRGNVTSNSMVNHSMTDLLVRNVLRTVSKVFLGVSIMQWAAQ